MPRPIHTPRPWPFVLSRLHAGRADLNSKNCRGETPLHQAVRSGARSSRATVVKLLAAGADLNIRDGEGDKPLHLAVVWFNAEAVELLLAAGADVYQRDAYGNSVLEMARGMGDSNAKVLRLVEAAWRALPRNENL